MWVNSGVARRPVGGEFVPAKAHLSGVRPRLRLPKTLNSTGRRSSRRIRFVIASGDADGEAHHHDPATDRRAKIRRIRSNATRLPAHRRHDGGWRAVAHGEFSTRAKGMKTNVTPTPTGSRGVVIPGFVNSTDVPRGTPAGASSSSDDGHQRHSSLASWLSRGARLKGKIVGTIQGPIMRRSRRDPCL
ncbi:hypothetical protein HDG33_007104 [Paraburkholderia sp. Cpub6]|nr:hypothetical protein [Paraburkholderia sp. Cpub6]